MRFIDALLSLALAARIHGTDKAVSRTARLVVKRVAAQHRPIVANVLSAPSPCAMVRHIVATIPDWMITPRADPEPIDGQKVA